MIINEKMMATSTIGILKNKKIGFFIRDLAGGGAEKVAVNIANELSARGMDVYFYVVNKEGRYIEKLSKNIKLRVSSSNRIFLSFYSLRKMLIEDGIETLVSNLTHENIIAAMAVLGTNIKLIAVEHNNFDKEMRDRGNLVFVSTQILYRIFSTRFDKLVCVSKGVERELREKYPKLDVYTIHNPIIEPEIYKQAEAVFDDIKSNYIISVGRLSEQKNYLFLLEVFKDLITRNQYNGLLVILGEGQQKDILTQKIHDLDLDARVMLLGFKENPYPYIKNAEVLVLTSRWEGFGNVLVEALGLGVKIVSSNCDYGPGEIVNGPDVGVLLQNFSVNEYSDAIKKQLQERGDIESRLRRANDFKVPVIVDKYLELI